MKKENWFTFDIMASHLSMKCILTLSILLFLGVPSTARKRLPDTLFVRFEDGIEIVSENSTRAAFHHERSITIARQHRKQPVCLLMPPGGTSTTIEIYAEADFLKHKDLKDLGNFIQGRTNSFVGVCNGRNLGIPDPIPTYLTSLKDGKYIARYVSCSYWATLKISIHTI